MKRFCGIANIPLTQKICLAGLFTALATILQKILAINYLAALPFFRISFGAPVTALAHGAEHTEGGIDCGMVKILVLTEIGMSHIHGGLLHPTPYGKQQHTGCNEEHEGGGTTHEQTVEGLPVRLEYGRQPLIYKV